MILDLSKEEIEIIEGWYHAASGESATDKTEEDFALLDKLGIHATGMDLWIPDPAHSIESHRPAVEAKILAILRYRERHLDYEEVQDAIRDQPE